MLSLILLIIYYMKLICWISLFFSSCFCYAQTGDGYLKTNADDNTLLWEISGNGLTNPGYLFGTFHMLCADEIQFSTSLKKAIAKSREVYLELDLDDPAVFAGAVMMISMKGGKKLKDLYSPEAYQRISAYFKDRLKTALSLYQNMKPGFLTALLYPKMMTCSSTISVDEAIMNLAQENNIGISGFETMAMQAAVFDSIPYEKQAEELLKAIDSIRNSVIQFRLMLQAYKDQQLHDIEKIINDPVFGVEEDRDLLLDKRNKRWVEQLKEIMKKGTVFIAVGAGHLVGKNGLIELLRAEGYTVRGLENRD